MPLLSLEALSGTNPGLLALRIPYCPSFKRSGLRKHPDVGRRTSSPRSGLVTAFSGQQKPGRSLISPKRWSCRQPKGRRAIVSKILEFCHIFRCSLFSTLFSLCHLPAISLHNPGSKEPASPEFPPFTCPRSCSTQTVSGCRTYFLRPRTPWAPGPWRGPRPWAAVRWGVPAPGTPAQRVG